jgi:ElaB/YqjD/DUF883 family membrane-anchored ribosome-binding protein
VDPKKPNTLTGATERAQNQAANAADRAAQGIERTSDRLSDAVRGAADDLRNANAGDLVDTAKQKAGEALDTAAEKVDSAMTATGQRVESLASTVREKAPEGALGDVATTAADALEKSGRYLQQADPQQVRSDLERMIRDHPIEALLIGFGAGFLLARAFRR